MERARGEIQDAPLRKSARRAWWVPIPASTLTCRVKFAAGSAVFLEDHQPRGPGFVGLLHADLADEEVQTAHFLRGHRAGGSGGRERSSTRCSSQKALALPFGLTLGPSFLPAASRRCRRPPRTAGPPDIRRRRYRPQRSPSRCSRAANSCPSHPDPAIYRYQSPWYRRSLRPGRRRRCPPGPALRPMALLDLGEAMTSNPGQGLSRGSRGSGAQ